MRTSSITSSLPTEVLKKQYRTLIAEISERNHLKCLKQGQAWGKLPIGYRYDDLSGAVVLDKARALQVAEAFELAGKKGMTLRKLLPLVQGMGLASRIRTPISLATLFRMLTNPFYVGTIIYKGKTYQGNHDSLVSKDLFETVQENLATRNKRRAIK